MIKFIVGLIIFGLIALAIIILIVINFSYKSFRQLRRAAEDQWELNQKRKEQKEKNPFGNDYFKSADGGSQQQRQQKYQQRGQQTTQQQSRQQTEKTTTRKTTTSSGVTIIDEREADSKIFSHDDGEYVEFEEV